MSDQVPTLPNTQWLLLLLKVEVKGLMLAHGVLYFQLFSLVFLLSGLTRFYPTGFLLFRRHTSTLLCQGVFHLLPLPKVLSFKRPHCLLSHLPPGLCSTGTISVKPSPTSLSKSTIPSSSDAPDHLSTTDRRSAFPPQFAPCVARLWNISDLRAKTAV